MVKAVRQQSRFKQRRLLWLLQEVKCLHFPILDLLVSTLHVWDEIEKVTALGANEKGFSRHNIVKYSDTEYAIELALGGYERADLDIETKPGVLIVRGTPAEDTKEYLHKGITTKKFVETFHLPTTLSLMEQASSTVYS